MLAAFFAFYRSQVLALANQERFLNAKQNAQIGLDLVARELRTAGSRPSPNLFPGSCTVAVSTATGCKGSYVVAGVAQKGFPSLLSASGTSLRFLADYRGNNLGDAPDGCPDDDREDIMFTYDAGTGRLMRTPGTGTATAVLEGIAANGFRFRYYAAGASGSPPAFVPLQAGGGSLTANEIASLTHIVISVTTTANSPGFATPVRTTQTTTVDMRNPAC